MGLELISTKFTHLLLSITVDATNSVPVAPQFRVINASNPVFLRDVVSVQGGVELMVALGFREDADGHLVLPMVRGY